MKYNSFGSFQWAVLETPNPCYNNANDLKLDASGNAYVTGGARISASNYNYLTIKYNPGGAKQWQAVYDGPAHSDDVSNSVSLDTSGNVYVTGYSYTSNFTQNFVTIKYSQLVGIRPISNEVPLEIKLHQNYPNPFNPMTKIKLELPPSPPIEIGKGRFITLKVYDMLGREVATLVNEHLNPGTYEVEFDGTNYPSGMYFYSLHAGDFSQTNKMVLIK